MENESTEVFLELKPSMVKEGTDQHAVVLFTKGNIGSDKPVPVVKLPPVIFIGGLSKQVRTGNIQGAWEPYRSVAVVTDVGVPVEEALLEIGMNSKRAVVHLECDYE